VRASDNWTNDPLSSREWWLPASSTDYVNTGQPLYVEMNPIGVDALDAWKQTTGSGVIVAVSDTGFDVSAPDMQGQWWMNPREIPSNGLDDDHNGIVDDVNGANFLTHVGNVWGPFEHGDEVASLISAQANNGIGIAGVAPGAKVMALRTGDDVGKTDVIAAAQAIEYAVSHGAKVINLSWGDLNDDCSYYLKQAFADADTHGVLIVVSAGNDHIDLDGKQYCPHLQAPNEVVVAATDETNEIAAFSNYGPASVALAAPGANITADSSGNRWGYNLTAGTSFSAPIAAAVAALAYSVRPNATAEMVKQALIDGSTPVTALKGKVISGGVVNAPNSLRLIEAMPQQPLPKPAPTTTATGSKPDPSTSDARPIPGARALAPARIFTLKHAAVMHFRWKITGKQRYLLLVDGKKIAHVRSTSSGRSLRLQAGEHVWLLAPDNR
jgi:hypothetical protein